ncbi:MAG: hypothetical protein VXW22_15815, partial [Pseudomonadota bacterium]|nr:hypothetical protein [Pseudomonadota bacterium]
EDVEIDAFPGLLPAFIKREGMAGEILEHPNLYENYPSMMLYRTEELTSDGATVGLFGGSIRNKEIAPYIGVHLARLADEGERRSTMLHELMHGVQDIEDFGRGGSTDIMPSEQPNPRYERWLREDAQDPEVIEIQRLRESAEYKNELQLANQKWRDEYLPQMDEIDKAHTRLRERAEEAGLADNEDELMVAINRERQALLAEQDRLIEEHMEKYPTPTADKVDELYDSVQMRGMQVTAPHPTIDARMGYLMLHGEAEARAVQAMKDMGPEDLNGRYPWEFFDQHLDDLIVRRGDGSFADEAVDLSPQAKRQRAAEQGFDTETVWYHGTDTNFDSFTPSVDGLSGPGIYLTTSPSYASAYSGYGAGDAPQVMPLYVRGNIASKQDFDMARNRPSTFARAVELGGNDVERALDHMHQAIRETLQDEGFTGFIQREGELVVFDPK